MYNEHCDESSVHSRMRYDDNIFIFSSSLFCDSVSHPHSAIFQTKLLLFISKKKNGRLDERDINFGTE